MAKSKAQASSKAATGSNYERNRQRRLEKHLKSHPNDAQSAKAEGNLSYRRKTPKAKNGWVHKTYAQVPMELRKTIMGKANLTAYALVLKNQKKAENELKHLPKETRNRISAKK